MASDPIEIEEWPRRGSDGSPPGASGSPPRTDVCRRRPGARVISCKDVLDGVGHKVAPGEKDQLERLGKV